MFSAAPGYCGTYTVAAVPVAGTCIYLLKNVFRAVAAAAVYGGGETEFGVAHQLNGFFIIAHFHNAYNGPERFFAHQLHIVRDICQHRWFKIISLAADSLSTG